MTDHAAPATAPLVTGSEIARIAGVTRAAVSNWRRRYDDFPAPSGGAASSPLFALAEVQAWLEKQRKGQDVSAEVHVWQELRAAYGEDMVAGLADVAELLSAGHGRRPSSGRRLSKDAAARVRALAEAEQPVDVVNALTERFADAVRRAGSDQVTSTRLARAVRHFAPPLPSGATVFDPACGIGLLLLSVAGRTGALCRGQEADADCARLARLRAALSSLPDARIETGDSLRDDRWPDLRAELVVCDPPVGVTEWGREELLLDPRWELGTPSKAEGELAWLQHAYAHTAPGGHAMIVLPASVAYRKAGRRIRAELVRRGILTQVVALPPGVASSHALPVHLWTLRRPESGDTPPATVRMVDLTGNDPDGGLDPRPEQTVEVPLINLLDDTVDLTPGSHLRAGHRDYPGEFTALRDDLEEQLHRLTTLLPQLRPGGGAGSLDGATAGVAELLRAGLVTYEGPEPVSASDQLDTDYLQGFLRSPANTRRATSASGSYRTETKGARIPQLAIEEQRRYGAAFRDLTAFEETMRAVSELSRRLADLAREGLCSGALAPED
ncbi:N-6 DNA methylase [Streptomyces sp. H27-C3]|uniref:N-6 DNA methylase n=1 Tax=Streptomyces sp. H27-C3 TaxID=3046305 RepID=UPI0024B8C881|nr:N-6 DNA methylase [Streptomyces sp. H27-C3]MDJ0465260.1 N-6 DNA methylase [Streptomyces sp. H27-C3]